MRPERMAYSHNRTRLRLRRANDQAYELPGMNPPNRLSLQTTAFLMRYHRSEPSFHTGSRRKSSAARALCRHSSTSSNTNWSPLKASSRPRQATPATITRRSEMSKDKRCCFSVRAVSVEETVRCQIRDKMWRTRSFPTVCEWTLV